MKITIIPALGAALVLFPIACKTPDPSAKLREDSTDAANAASTRFKTSLATEADYLALLRNDPATNTTYVKLTIDRKADGLPVYFQNTAVYPFHQTFLSTEIERFKGRTYTMDEILFGDTKEVSGGALYYAKDVKLPGMAETGVLGFNLYFAVLPNGDSQVNVDEIKSGAERIRASAPFAAGKVAYLFDKTKDWLANKTKLDALGIPSGRIAQVVGKGEVTTVYSAAHSYGYLKAISPADFDAGNYTSKDILVFAEVPIDVGPLAGIITSEAQVPHSHVIFRAVNQKIPDVYVPNALNLDVVKKRLGKLVELTATENNGFTIKDESEIPGIAALAEEYFKTRVPKLPPLQSDLAQTALLPIKATPPKHEQVTAYGTKGVNFGVIDAALRAGGYDRSIYDGAFLVPLAHYVAHVKQPLTDKICKKAAKDCAETADASRCKDAQKACDDIAANGGSLNAFLERMVAPAHAAKMISDNVYRKAYLTFAQEMIKKADLAPALVKTLTAEILKVYPPTARMRFRSSTNAEDLPGLNGAGLYVSKGACVADEGASDDAAPSKCMTPLEKQRLETLIAKLTALDPVKHKAMIDEMKDDLTKKKPLDKAVKKVFASIWTDKAFLTRDYYRIDHMKVAMAMLSHPSYVDEQANGVMVATRLPNGGLEVNVVAQKDDISVTNPELPGATPDQLIVVRAADGSLSETKYILHSNQVATGQAVLSAVQVQDLVRQAFIACEGLRKEYGEAYGARMDMEFKIDGAGKVLIKQGRPL